MNARQLLPILCLPLSLAAFGQIDPYDFVVGEQPTPAAVVAAASEQAAASDVVAATSAVEAATPDTRDWRVWFYPLRAEYEAYMALLKDTLPPGSRMEARAEAGVIAVYSSPAGIATAEAFVRGLEQAAARVGVARGAPTPTVQQVRLEFLALEQAPCAEVRSLYRHERCLSPEALAMGVEERDLALLSSDDGWRTIDKGVAACTVGSPFKLYLQGFVVEGQTQWVNAARQAVQLRLTWSELPPPTPAAGAGTPTPAAGSKSNGGPPLMVLRPNTIERLKIDSAVTLDEAVVLGSSQRAGQPLQVFIARATAVDSDDDATDAEAPRADTPLPR